MTERKMARIVQIDDIIPHTNADSLEIAKIGGWQVVVKKDEFKKGDHAVRLNQRLRCISMSPI